MRTTRFNGHLYGRGVSAQVGVSAQERVSAQEGMSAWGGGVSA